MAGLTRMPLRKFLTADVLGATLWSGTYLLVGYLFRAELERAADSMRRFGAWVLAVAGCALAAYIGWKYYQRRSFIRDLRVARVTPEELLQLLDSEEGVAIVDLRNALEYEFERVKIPGAIWMDAQQVEARHLEIPRDKDVVLYCS